MQDTYITIIVFLFNLVSFLSISLQPSGFYQNTIGYEQNIICSLSVPPDVDPDTVEFGWFFEDDIITDDSRVSIDTSNDYYNDSSLLTIIRFDPLFEDDEGEYICYAVINNSLIIEPFNLQNFTGKSIYIIMYVYACKHYITVYVAYVPVKPCIKGMKCTYVLEVLITV